MAITWFYQNAGQEYGPVSSQELKNLAECGKISRDDLVRKEADENWHFASEVTGLFPPMVEHSRGKSSIPITRPVKPASPPPVPVAPKSEMDSLSDSWKGEIVEQEPRHPNMNPNRLPLVLSAAALVVAVVALVLSLLPAGLPGKGLDAYDFSSPAAAYRSQLELQADGDLAATIEFSRLVLGGRIREKLKTLKIDSESDYGGKKILFISFQQNGIEKRDIEWLEKNVDSGLWFPSYDSTWNMGDEELKAKIEKWKND